MRMNRRQLIQSITGLSAASLTGGWVIPRFASAQNTSPQALSWDEAVKQSRGSTVRWAMWGGSERINQFVDGWVATQLKQTYDLSLQRIPLSDTVEAVNKVFGEVKAGQRKGSIDLIWINGENFRTMKQGNLLWGPFTEQLPSLNFYDLKNATVITDFGLPIDGFESPYTGSYFATAYDSAKVKTLPRSFADLLDWAKANPGRFTYVAPPAFDGSRFILTAFYATTGGFEQYTGSAFKAELWERQSPKVVAYLKALEPYLWRQGQTYPPTQARLGELFANGEIWMMPAFVNQISEGIANQQFPPTTQAFAIPGAVLNDPSFTAIPINAPNPAGGMVLANLLSSPAGQLEKFKPAVWGDPPLLTLSKLPPDQQKAFAEVEKSYGVSLQEIIAAAVPVVNAEYTTRLEKVWQQQIAS